MMSERYTGYYLNNIDGRLASIIDEENHCQHIYPKDFVKVMNQQDQEIKQLKKDKDKLKVEDENLNEKLDFIMNLLFTIYCHSDVHYSEMLGYLLGEAERIGFNVNPSKTWDYNKEDFEYKLNEKE